MARAHEHLASARYAEAAGAFRAVLRIDPNEFQAHFGLADALVARGQHGEAVEGLVAAAESCTAREDHGAALTLYGKALAVDPMRLELHLDVAMAEAALGRMEAAQSRLEHLAEVYMQAGRTDEAAEVYRCLAGWEGDGEELEAEPEPEPEPAVQRRVTEVPGGAPVQPLPRDAVPMAVPSSETVVIPTILITPDGQLYQVPIEQQAEAWAPASGDSVPPLPADLLEVVHSAPIDLAAGEQIPEVERTVVAYPPPPPSLPEGYESAAHTVDRAALEDAVVAALDNLAQLEEEDATLVMQRLPPNHKLAALRRAAKAESRLPEFVTRSRMPKPELPPEPAPEPELTADEELEADEDLAADADLQDDAELETAAPPEPVVEEPAPESKLRIKPAPRPVTKTPAPVPGVGPQPVAGKPAAAAGKPAAPGGAAKPSPAASGGPGRGGAVGKASAPLGAGKPAAVSKPAASRPASTAAAAKPGGVASRPAATSAAAKPTLGGAKPSTASKPSAPATTAAATKPGLGGKPSSVAAKPAATSRPGAPPASTTARPGNSPRPTSGTIKSSVTSQPAATSKPAPTSKPAAAPARPASTAARPSPALGSARPPAGEAPKLTRPDNPLAERLRRRAGLQKPEAAPSRAEPRPTDPRATEPIIVRSPSTLPPANKKK